MPRMTPIAHAIVQAHRHKVGIFAPKPKTNFVHTSGDPNPLVGSEDRRFAAVPTPGVLGRIAARVKSVMSLDRKALDEHNAKERATIAARIKGE